MLHPARARQFAARFVVVVMAATAALLATGPASAAAPPRPIGAPPEATGLPQVGVPRAPTPRALPRKAGAVPLRAGQHIGPAGKAPAGKAPAGKGRALAAPTDNVRLSALIVGVDADDFGIATWKATLDRVGAAYDVFYSRSSPLTPSTLVAADGSGRYNAILLTNSMLLYAEGGSYLSGLNVEEWNRLWAYERDYGVRQAALYTSYGTWPENYCLTGAGEGGVGDTPLTAGLTGTGAQIFDYLRADAPVKITQSYVYRARIAAGCAAEPVLTAGDDVLAVRSLSTDGRDRLALTFTSNQYLLQSNLLVYGMFRWATRGLHLGEQRRFLNVDIDDWFNSADHFHEDGHVEYEGYRVTGHDAYNLDQRQSALRAEHPTAAGFTLSLAYNGEDADPGAGSTCAPGGGIDTLTATSRCLAGNFRWINHTLTHPEMNFTDYATSRAEIANNLTVAGAIGLSVPTTVLKTGEYSGLGVYTDDPDNDTGPPVDHGLGASNPHLLRAAKDLGVRYVHGNMSFRSHVPSCFNCGITHPLEPSITLVPDWPTNIAYFTTTPPEQTAFYNSFFGPNGKFPYWSRDLTYDEIIDYEAELALGRLSSGSLYSHTFHIANVRDYGAGRTMVTDWLDRVLDKYEALYQAPVLSPDSPTLGAYAQARTGHYAALAAGASAMYDRATGTVTVSAPQDGTVTVSGVQTPQSQTYATEISAPVTVTAGTPVTVAALARS